MPLNLRFHVLKLNIRKSVTLSLLSSPYLPVIVSSGACLWLYLLRDSFWRDESKLLLNIIHKSFLGLTCHLDYGQEAPLIFLWLYRVIFLAGGQSELTFRFVSLLATICALLLFQKLARNLFYEKSISLFITWLFALSPGVIFFAVQAKQYATDILVSTFLIWLASSTLFSSNPTTFRIFLLALCAVIAPWVSLPAVFSVCPLVILIFLKAQNKMWIRLNLCFLPGISCLLALLMVMSRSFSPDHSKLGSAFKVIAYRYNHRFDPIYAIKTIVSSVFFGYLGFEPLSLMFLSIISFILLYFIGKIISYRLHGWAMPFLLGSPVAIALMLLLIKLYPSPGRAFLFATPAIYLLVGFGLIFLYQRIPYRKPLYVFFLLLLSPCIVTFWCFYSQPVGGVRDALEFIARNQYPGTLVLCDPYSASSVACYQALRNPTANKLHYVNRPEDWIEERIELSQIGTLTRNLLLPYDHRPVCFLAETEDYTRAEKGEHGFLPKFDDDIVKYLPNSRQLEYSYTTLNVQVRGFAEVSIEQANACNK